LVAATTLAFSIAMFARPPVAASETVAVVPFAAPGTESNRILDDATGIFGAALRDHGITASVIEPMNPVAAVRSAPEICARTGATAILVPAARTEQNVRTQYYVVLSVIYFATHAELRLSRLRCDGSLAWSVVTTGDKSYDAANVQAGVADAVSQASTKAIDAYVARAPDAAAPSPPPAAPASLGSKVAIVPFTQPGSPDPSLDFATEEALRRYRAKGFDAVVTAAMEHLAAANDAAGICATYAASKLVMGTLRTEQTSKLSGVATHAEILLTTVDCKGQVIGQQDLRGEHFHHGSNARAGVSSAIEDAFGHWAQAQ
jgi:hypothetical protein